MPDLRKLRRLRRLKLDRVDLVGAGANPGAYVALHKSEQARTNETDANIPVMTEAEKAAKAAEDAKLEAAAKAATEKTEAEQAAKAKADAEAEAKKAAELEKQKADEKIAVTKAEHEAVAKKLADAEAEIAKMRDEQELAKFTEIAKSELGSLPEKAETMGALLRKAKGALDEAEFQSLFRLLKAANAQSDTSVLFKQFADGNDDEPQSAEEQITAKAEELRKADPSLTIEQATAKVMADSPELRKAYGAQQGN